MPKNVITPPTDAKVVFVFDFQNSEFSVNGLDNFTNITVDIGSESYSTVGEPSRLYTDGTTKLVLDIGDITNLEAGYYIPTIKGFNPIYDDGVTLNDDGGNNRLDSFVFVYR